MNLYFHGHNNSVLPFKSIVYVVKVNGSYFDCIILGSDRLYSWYSINSETLKEDYENYLKWLSTDNNQQFNL